MLLPEGRQSRRAPSVRSRRADAARLELCARRERRPQPVAPPARWQRPPGRRSPGRDPRHAAPRAIHAAPAAMADPGRGRPIHRGCRPRHGQSPCRHSAGGSWRLASRDRRSPHGHRARFAQCRSWVPSRQAGPRPAAAWQETVRRELQTAFARPQAVRPEPTSAARCWVAALAWRRPMRAGRRRVTPEQHLPTVQTPQVALLSPPAEPRLRFVAPPLLPAAVLSPPQARQRQPVALPPRASLPD